jgi:hypothetical protein
MAEPNGPSQVNSAISFFASILKNYENIVILPVARHQALDDLKALSATLKSLRDDKRKANEDALRGNWEGLDKRLPQLETRVSDLRTQTQSFANNFPDQYRSNGIDVSDALFNGLSYKINLISNARQEIEQGHSEKVKAEMACTVKVLSVLSGCIEGVISKLSGLSTDITNCKVVPAADSDASTCAAGIAPSAAHQK